MDKREKKEISERFRSVGELPPWLTQGLPLSTQIGTIRQVLGMTQAELAERVGVTQHAVSQIENSKGSDFRISTLRKMGKALNAELIVSLVPREEIFKLLERKGREAAEEIISLSSGNAALELALPERSFVEQQTEKLKNEILEKYPSVLWQKT